MQFAILLLALVGGALAVPYGGGLVNTGHSAQYRHDDPAHGTYEFGYNEDHATGGTFRKEKGGPGYQVGSYGLRDADGRMRIVHYIADAHGFRVKISTNEEGVDVKQDPASTSLNSVHQDGPIGHHLSAVVESHAIAPIADNYHHKHLPVHNVHHQPEHHYIEQPVHYSQEEVHAQAPIAPVHRISAPAIHHDNHYEHLDQHNYQHLSEPLYSSPTHAEPLTFGQRLNNIALNKASLLYPSGSEDVQSHSNYGPALGATLMASVYAGGADHGQQPQPVLSKSAYVPDEASYGSAEYSSGASTAGHYDHNSSDYQRGYY